MHSVEAKLRLPVGREETQLCYLLPIIPHVACSDLAFPMFPGHGYKSFRLCVFKVC